VCGRNVLRFLLIIRSSRLCHQNAANVTKTTLVRDTLCFTVYKTRANSKKLDKNETYAFYTQVYGSTFKEWHSIQNCLLKKYWHALFLFPRIHLLLPLENTNYFKAVFFLTDNAYKSTPLPYCTTIAPFFSFYNLFVPITVSSSANTPTVYRPSKLIALIRVLDALAWAKNILWVHKFSLSRYSYELSNPHYKGNCWQELEPKFYCCTTLLSNNVSEVTWNKFLCNDGLRSDKWNNAFR
jgi:hypothetical protein